jgi:iron complex outermembrane recepter protein
MSLEELTQIEVVSFRNKVQKLSRVPGAIYVITREEIERSGMSSVPELLRLVPGLHVARVNGSQWAIGSRGTVGVTQPRLLVLIDGRSIYTPIFSGVYWDMGMPLLEDIDRIEVIRGPGATIWGANAVLGVINIVTRHSKETQDTLVVAGGGSGDRAFGRVRFGGATKSFSWRGYAVAEDHAALSQVSGGSAGDGWNTEQAGFRMDGEREHSSWMLEGSASVNPGRLTSMLPSLEARGFARAPMDMDNAAGNLTGEYRRLVGKTGELRANFYYDQIRRQHTVDRIAHVRTWNGDVRYDFAAGDRHSLSAGGGARTILESVPGTGGAYLSPESMDCTNYNVFAQDEVSLLRDRLILTLGAKLEHNPFTGWGAEPSASLLWQASKHHTFWASGARALRTPSFVERSIILPLLVAQAGTLPVFLIGFGNSQVRDEVVTDYQVGYRADPKPWLSLSISLYRDNYQHFRSVTPGMAVLQMTPIPALIVNNLLTNLADGNGKGAETTVTWQHYRSWKLEGSHTYGATRAFPMATAPAGTMAVDLSNPPRNQWVLRSSWNVGRHVETDVNTFWWGRTASEGFLGRMESQPYTRLDVRIGYKVGENWTLSVTGQNLLTPRHFEGLPEALTDYSYVTRGVTFKSVWRF